jgi:tetratricopeptide (TPR) repeat protein
MTRQLAEKFLEQAEELIKDQNRDEELLLALDQAEQSDPCDAWILCRAARILFRYGILNGKERFFLLALDKLNLAEEKDSKFFDSCFIWLQLWGNILIQLGKLFMEDAFFSQGLEKYQRAFNMSCDLNADLFWDWGEAFSLMGQVSGESSDFQQALGKFQQANYAGMHSPFFYLDYGDAFTLYGTLIGNPFYVEEGLQRYKEAISATCFPNKEPSIIHIVAWNKLAIGMKVRYQLSHEQRNLEEADSTIKEAILLHPRNRELWLDWAELYLQAGWIKRDVAWIEIGLEKLTSSKIKECDPVRVCYLLGTGLVMYGLFLDNLKLLHDGYARIKETLQAVPESQKLQFALGFANLGFALYFSDSKFFAEAVALFEKRIREQSDLADNWHALFQAYLAWGVTTENPDLIAKGLEAVRRLCELVPFSSCYLNEWGVALLRLSQNSNQKVSNQSYIEEAIDKFKKSMLLSEEEETLYNWGCALDLLGEATGNEEHYSQAVDFLAKVLEKKPNQLHVRYHLGLALLHLGELIMNEECLIQAVELLEAVAKVDQDDSNVWCDLGYALLNLAEFELDSIFSERVEMRRCDAEKALLKAAKFGSGEACYHLACLYSIVSLCDASLQYLRKAEALGFLPEREDLEQDEWLETVRKTEAFHEFLMSLSNDGRE